MKLPPSACGSVGGVRHRVHACCYAECLPAEEWTKEERAANYPTCPRCRLLRRRLHLGVGSRAEEAGGEAAAGEAAGEVAMGEGGEGATAMPEAAKQGGAGEQGGGDAEEEKEEKEEEKEEEEEEEEEGDLWIGKDVTDANGTSLGGLRLSTKLLELRRLLQATPPSRRRAAAPPAPPRFRTAAPPHHRTTAPPHRRTAGTSAAGDACRRQDPRVLVL